MKQINRRQGSASALIILVLTVLVLLGVLSLVTVAADRRLAGKRADWLQAYYQLDAEAVVIQAKLSDAIVEKISSSQSEAAFEDMAMLARQALDQAGAKEVNVEIFDDPGSLEVSYIVGDISSESSTQLLEIKLAVSIADNGALMVDKLKWQQRQSERPQTDETGVIWIPE